MFQRGSGCVPAEDHPTERRQSTGSVTAPARGAKTTRVYLLLLQRYVKPRVSKTMCVAGKTKMVCHPVQDGGGGGESCAGRITQFDGTYSCRRYAPRHQGAERGVPDAHGPGAAPAPPGRPPDPRRLRVLPAPGPLPDLTTHRPEETARVAGRKPDR